MAELDRTTTKLYCFQLTPVAFEIVGLDDCLSIDGTRRAEVEAVLPENGGRTICSCRCYSGEWLDVAATLIR
jgi:hypothetical protein